MNMIIDAHHHFWQLDKFDYGWLEADALEPIRRDYLPSDLESLIRPVGVEKTVFVQTQHNMAETRWGLEMAHRHDFLAGVVGWVDLQNERCEEQLLELKQDPNFVGVRHVTHDEPDVDFIVRPRVLEGLRVLERHEVPFDLLFYVHHLRHVPTLARYLPNLPLVIDHLSKPPIKQRRTDEWITNFKNAAACANVSCKLSGMVTEADWNHWKPADLKPYVQLALDLFGPARCMFGSDWPVCELAATYAEVYEALVEAVGPISQDERAAIFGGTARKFYKLQL